MFEFKKFIKSIKVKVPQSPRVVCSFTTISKRIPYIKRTIKSILSQTYPIDLLYVNIPDVSLKGGNIDIPYNMQRFIDRNPRIKLIRGDDNGPVNKISSVLDYEEDPETIIITFDDDMIIHPDTVEVLINKHERYPHSALSYSGWNYGGFPFYFQIVNSNTKDTEVDWIQGTNGILYKRKFLNKDDLLDYSRVPEEMQKTFRTNDDHWIARHLAQRGVKRISIGKCASDYFEITKAERVDPISKGLTFLKGVNDSAKYIAKEGYYTHNDCKMDSKVFAGFVGLLLFLGLGYLLIKNGVSFFIVIPIIIIFAYLFTKKFVIP